MSDVLPRAFGKYLLERRLGVGGMAETFVARREGAGGIRQHVCLKRVLPAFNGDQNFRAQFQREAKLAARLRHTNIVGTIDYGDVDEVQYMALELVEGIDLRALLSHLPDRRLAVPLVLVVAFDIAHALEYAHEAREGRDGIVHRDVTPSNILLSIDGAVKLADFGVAKSLGTATAMTATGVMKGKMPYMPPEQMKGGDVDGRVDLFSLGVLMYEALAGRRPFVGAHDVEVMSKIITGERPTLKSLMPHLDDALADIVEGLLAIETAERTASASALIDQLAPFVPPPKFRRELADLVREAYGEERHEGEGSDTQLAEASELPKGSEGTPDAFAPTLAKASDVSTAGAKPKGAVDSNDVATAGGKGRVRPRVSRPTIPQIQGTEPTPAPPVRDEPATRLGYAPAELASPSPSSVETEELPKAPPSDAALDGATTLDLEPPPAREAIDTGAVPRPPTRTRLPWVAALLVAVAGLGFAFWPGDETVPVNPPEALASTTAAPAGSSEGAHTASAEPGVEVPLGEAAEEPEVPEPADPSSEPEANEPPANEPEAPAEDSPPAAESQESEPEASEPHAAPANPPPRRVGSAEMNAPAADRRGSAMGSTMVDEPEAPARRARVRVSVAPWGDVWVDGRYMGRAPVTVRLSQGSHTIAGGQERPLIRRRVRVGEDARPFSVHLNLESALSME